MPVTVKGSGGGGVTLDAGAAASNTTLTLPNVSGTILAPASGVLPVANGGTGLSSTGAAGGVLFTADGSTWSATQKITQGTSVSASGTSIDFTSIPSWVKRISMMFYTVSINGSSRPMVRLGTSGGIVTSGYSGTQYGVSGTGGAFLNISSGFDLIDNGSAVSGCNFCGILTIDKLGTGNDWVANWTGGLVNGACMQSMGGAISIGGALTTVRLTTVGGAVLFTGGTVNILYE